MLRKPASGGTKNGKAPCLSDAACFSKVVEAAMQHQQARQEAATKAVAAGTMVILNVLQLNMSGMLKDRVLQTVKNHLLTGALQGLVLITYPQVPSGSFRSRRTATLVTQSSTVAAAMSHQEHQETSFDSDHSDSEIDEPLPEVMTKSVSTASHWDKQIQLADDHHQIESRLGRHNMTKYLPKNIVFSHRPGVIGVQSEKKRVERALLLVPSPSSMLLSESTRTKLERTTLLQDGVYTDIEDTGEYIKVTEDLSRDCFKSQAQDWRTDGLKCPCRGKVANKDARGQWGCMTYECLFKDVIKALDPGSTLLICDFTAGVGEVGVAATHVRASQEARDHGVCVCYWGNENRKKFYEIARANINTTMGELFLANRLTVTDLQPIQPPGELASGRSTDDGKLLPTKALILEELDKAGTPLKQLSIHESGNLMLPTLEEWAQQEDPPVPMTEQLADTLQNLRQEFESTLLIDCRSREPHSQPLQPSIAVVMPSKTQYGSREEILAFGRILKEVSVPGDNFRYLLVKLTEQAIDSTVSDPPYRVLVEATHDIDLPAGHFMGRCGRGTFKLLHFQKGETVPHGREGSNAWTFNKGKESFPTAPGKDVRGKCRMGNTCGMWILESDTLASGTVDPEVPKTCTFEMLHEALGTTCGAIWAHHITLGCRKIAVKPADTGIRVLWVPSLAGTEEGDIQAFGRFSLSAFLPSWESWELKKGGGVVGCTGVLQPAFPLEFDQKKTLVPVGNAVCLFLQKPLKLKKNHLIIL